MAEMVKLTKEQDKALKYWMNEISLERDEYEKKADLLQLHAESSNDWSDISEPLNEISFSDLAKALYVGYTVEETPEEKLKEFYDDFQDRLIGEMVNEDYAKGVRKGVKKTLEIMKIKVKGINE